jgi:hypothetical protein
MYRNPKMWAQYTFDLRQSRPPLPRTAPVQNWSRMTSSGCPECPADGRRVPLDFVPRTRHRLSGAMPTFDRSSEQRQEEAALAEDVLALYLKAAGLRRLNVAEHLLQALEELTKSQPCCREVLDRAYTEIARLPQRS